MHNTLGTPKKNLSSFWGHGTYYYYLGGGSITASRKERRLISHLFEQLHVAINGPKIIAFDFFSTNVYAK